MNFFRVSFRYLARPACIARRRAYVLPRLLSFIILLTVALIGDRLSQNVLDRSSSNFLEVCIRVDIINPIFFRDRSRDTATVTDFCVNRRKLAHRSSIIRHALAPDNGREDRNTDARVNTADDLSTSDKNLVSFGPAISEFCRRVCAGRATTTSLQADLCHTFL